MEKRNQKVKIGIIGVGRMGTYHANVLTTLNNDIDFVGIYDIDEERARFIAEKYNTRAYESREHLLDNAEGICIAVPTHLHYEIAKSALQMGVHTLVEKPVACKVEEAQELVRTAKKSGLIFQVGHVERFKGAVLELRNIVQNPYLVEARRLSPWENKDWDTGVVLDLMIHDIDIVLSLIKSEVENIDAVGKSIKSRYEDIASAVLLFKNGAIANITSSRLSETRMRTMSISQENAFVNLNFETQDINIYRGSSAKFFVVSQKEIDYKQEFFVERVLVQKENALKEELQHFADCILGKVEPIVQGEDDINTLKITLEIVDKIYMKLGSPQKSVQE
ncbi:MAG: Gfo/Idh/MocA family oxidoreductase [Spirochaetota bacterium]|nr:MAG: Gfo/Idh/MocA family oxidoreductase [Spirochaetota bacterium]